MKKYFVVGAVAIALAWFAVVYFYVHIPKAEAPTTDIVVSSVHHDYKNIGYMIDGQEVNLINGVSEIAAATGSASMIVTKYFGNETKTDLNADGKNDEVFLLTQEPGGSGAFFYVVAALKDGDSYKGSEAFLIGDRVAPQSIEVRDGFVIVNYATRKEGAPFADQPTEGKSLRLKFDAASMKFFDVAEGPKIDWSFEKSGDLDIAPKSKVTLTFNGKSSDVGTYSGVCSPVTDLLPDEVSAVLCWWAGAGDEIGVFKNGESYVVKTGSQGEGDAQSPGFRGDFEILNTLE
jgi:hypothetical protein